ncbi:MAG TPA: class I SAM-dependent methyltransferase [Kiloniellaceae bacterium]|nr:class I SAM-dependent methyltransferase [Kiloniellaceae bacterium]
MGLKKAALWARPLADAVLLVPTAAAAATLRLVRRLGLQRLPWTRKTLFSIGIFPLRRDYYEPAFHPADLPGDQAAARPLPGLDMNLPAQLRRLQEIVALDAPPPFPDRRPPGDPLTFFYENENFKSGDACAWWATILLQRPRCIVEVGSGYSTLIARQAIAALPHDCRHICIEPYEQPWMERCGAEILRRPVESLDPATFDALAADDILFIDSSHMIRPGGDVLFLYQQVLPRLKPGVLVHIHDIFTPRDYLPEWLFEENKFWNEQYLLEAFLAGNGDYEVVLALNHLKHERYAELNAAFPRLTPDREPGSFYIRRKENAGPYGPALKSGS